MRYTDESCIPDDIVRQSLDWLVRLTSGGVTAAESQAFLRWRAQSAVHAKAFCDALALRQQLLLAAGELVSEGPRTVVHADFSRPARVSRRALWGGAIAASVAGVVTTGMQIGWLPTVGEMTADYRTATGQQEKIAFGPGLAFELNTQTSLSLRSQRAVEVLSGEAAFDVKLPRREVFTVAALKAEIFASDATFNVRNTDDNVCLTCLRGHLVVVRGRQFTKLSPGLQIVYSAKGWGGPHQANVEAETAWRNGVVMFRDLALSQVLHEVNRYRPGKIVIADSQLGNRRFSGLVQIKRPNAILAQLEGLGVKVVSLPGGLVLVS